MGGKEKTEPIVERDTDARRRLHELPDQPQHDVVRGYGAMNPVEGELDKADPRIDDVAVPGND